MKYCLLVSDGSRNMKIKNWRKTKMAFGKSFNEKIPPWVIFFFTQKFSSILWKRPRSVDWELLGKVDIIFFSSVKLIDVFWLQTNTCENNTHSIWEARKTRRKGELHKIPITKRFIALRCYFSRLQYGLLVFCKVWWCKGSIKKKCVQFKNYIQLKDQLSGRQKYRSWRNKLEQAENQKETMSQLC